MSNYVLINRGNFHLKLLRRFQDIEVFVVGSFILPHPVDFKVTAIVDVEYGINGTRRTIFTPSMDN